jgi:transposase
VEADLLKTLPYVGPILSMVMTLEIGRVERFASAAHLASYAGLVPRVHSSGGRTRLGQICGDINRYLKWAFQVSRWRGGRYALWGSAAVI